MHFKNRSFLNLLILGGVTGSCGSHHTELNVKSKYSVQEAEACNSNLTSSSSYPYVSFSNILGEKYENYSVDTTRDSSYVANLNHTISFTFEGTNYEVIFKNNRTDTIKLFEKKNNHRYALNMPNALASFCQTGDEYPIQYLHYLQQVSSHVTPILNIYGQWRHLNSGWNHIKESYDNPSFQAIQNQYLEKNVSEFSTYFTAFKEDRIDFLIIPLHHISCYKTDPLEEAEAHTKVQHIDCAILFKDDQKRIQLTLTDTTALERYLADDKSDTVYNTIQRETIDKRFIAINTISALLGDKTHLLGVELHDHYELSDEGFCRKNTGIIEDCPIYKIGLHITKQFSKSGCAMASLRLIHDVLLHQNPKALHTICSQDYCIESEITRITYTNYGITHTFVGNEYEYLCKREPEKVKKEHVSLYTLHRDATIRSDIFKDVMTRVMLYLEESNYRDASKIFEKNGAMKTVALRQ